MHARPSVCWAARRIIAGSCAGVARLPARKSAANDDGPCPFEKSGRTGFASTRSSPATKAEPVGKGTRAVGRDEAGEIVLRRLPQTRSDCHIVAAFANIAQIIMEGGRRTASRPRPQQPISRCQAKLGTFCGSFCGRGTASQCGRSARVRAPPSLSAHASGFTCWSSTIHFARRAAATIGTPPRSV